MLYCIAQKIFFRCRIIWVLLSILLILTHPVHAVPLDSYTFSTDMEAKRFESLSKTVRCVVCQGQSIADSNAPLAMDLRAKIYDLIIAEKSDEEIKDFLVSRYGEFILLEPRWHAQTLLLWLFPFVGIVFILVLMLRLVSIKRR